MSRGRPPSVFVRRLSPIERRRLCALVRRGCREQVTYRRALVVLQSAQRCPVPEIARVLQASPDWVREVICAFNREGLGSLPPRWAGGRPRRITAGMRARIIEVAETRPQLLGEPFASWSLAHLRDYLIRTRVVPQISVERLREILREEGFSLQRTKSWKRSPDPEFSEKAARVEDLYRAVEAGTLEGVVVFDEHGPCQPIPKGGPHWARRGWPRRIPANYRKPYGVRFFLGAYDVGADQLWGRWSPSKASPKILSFFRAIRRRYPPETRIFLVMDNLSAHWTEEIRDWAEDANCELVPTPTYASWLNRIEAEFGAMVGAVFRGSDYQNHQEIEGAVAAYLRRRNTIARRDREARQKARARRREYRAARRARMIPAA